MKSDRIFLEHILDEIHFLLKQADDQSFETFIHDEVTKRAYSRSIEIIGEAVKNLSAGFKRKHKEVEWKKIAGLRDKIIHQYFGVNYDIVWDVIKNKLPTLKGTLEKILADLEKDEVV